MNSDYSNTNNYTEGQSLKPPGEWMLWPLPSTTTIQEAVDMGQSGKLLSL